MQIEFFKHIYSCTNSKIAAACAALGKAFGPSFSARYIVSILEKCSSLAGYVLILKKQSFHLIRQIPVKVESDYSKTGMKAGAAAPL